MTNGLIGEYTHKLDSKHRVSLPSKIRSIIGEVVVMSKGLDGAAYVYSLDAWQTITEKLQNLSLGSAAARSFNRFILSSATEIAIDKSGRILIPENVRDHASLSDEVVIIGVGNRLELWNVDGWREQVASVDSSIEDFAEDLSEIGLI